MTLKQNITLNYLISEKPNWLISFARGYKDLKSALQVNYRENELECLNLCGLDNRGLNQSEQDKKFFFELKEIAQDLNKKNNEDNFRALGLKGEEASYD